MTAIILHHNIGSINAGRYAVANIFHHDGYDTMFFARVLKNGTVSAAMTQRIVLNSTLNPDAPGIGQLDALVEKGLITVVE